MSDDSINDAYFIDAPHDPDLIALHAYWLSKRGARDMPSRPEIVPAEIKPLLPHVILYDAAPDRRYRIRLVGEGIVQFVGANLTGEDVTARMEPKPAATMRALLDMVANERRPIFRAGKAWWWREKAYRDFEACFLPLSPAGAAVDIVLGGIKFAT